MGIKQALLICTFILLSAGISTAQVRKLTIKEFDRQMDAAFGAAEKKVRRISVTVTVFDRGKETRSGTSTFEYIPPDRFRSHWVSSSGLQEESGEYIEASNKHYIREEDGVWRYFAYGCSDIPPYLFWSVHKDGPGAKIKTSEFRKDALNGRTVQKYSRESRQNFENIKGYPPSPPVDGLEEVWIGSDGLVLRAESIYYHGDKKNLSQKWVLNYEYDPKGLRIEAPIK